MNGKEGRRIVQLVNDVHRGVVSPRVLERFLLKIKDWESGRGSDHYHDALRALLLVRGNGSSFEIGANSFVRAMTTNWGETPLKTKLLTGGDFQSIMLGLSQYADYLLILGNHRFHNRLMLFSNRTFNIDLPLTFGLDGASHSSSKTVSLKKVKVELNPSYFLSDKPVYIMTSYSLEWVRVILNASIHEGLYAKIFGITYEGKPALNPSQYILSLDYVTCLL